TVCTSGLGSGDEAVARAVKRGLEASRQRAELDEDAWAALRKTCPGMNGEPRDLELRVAKRLLSDRRLYTRVLHPRPPSFASSRAAATGAPCLGAAESYLPRFPEIEIPASAKTAPGKI